MDCLSRNLESYRLSLYETLENLSETELCCIDKVLCTLDGRAYVRRVYGEDKRALFETLKETDCPFIPRIKEVFLTTDTVVIEEFVAGRTVADVITDGALTAAQVRSCAEGLFSALAALHARGVIHRDVKPENIMFADDGTVRLIDYGIARFYKEDEKRDTEKFGTAGYAAPEQYGFGQSDARTDLYAAGITLLKMCEAAGLNGPVKAAALKCSKFDPQNRFKNAEEALKYLNFRQKLPYFAVLAAVLAVLLLFFAYKAANPPAPAEHAKTAAQPAAVATAPSANQTKNAPKSPDLPEISPQNAPKSEDMTQKQVKQPQLPQKTPVSAASRSGAQPAAKSEAQPQPGASSQQKAKPQLNGDLTYPDETDALIVTPEPQPALLLLQRGKRSQTAATDLNGARIKASARLQAGVLTLSLDDGQGHAFKRDFSLDDGRPLASRDYQTSDTDAEVLFTDLDGDGRTEIFPALSNRKYAPIADQKGYLVNSIAAWCVTYSPSAGFALDRTRMTDDRPYQFSVRDHKIWRRQGLEAYMLSNGELRLEGH